MNIDLLADSHLHADRLDSQPHEGRVLGEPVYGRLAKSREPKVIHPAGVGAKELDRVASVVLTPPCPEQHLLSLKIIIFTFT